MEQKKEERMQKRQIVIGMDISREYLQMSYMDLREGSPVTLRPGKQEEYNIPMCLAKRHEMNQWAFGTEAIKCARQGKGILITDLYTLAKDKQTVTVEEKEISGEELFLLYIKKCYALLQFLTSGNEAVSLMITVESLKDAAVELLNKVRERLPIENSRIFFGDRQECLYYYVLNQSEELWHYQVAVFDFTGESLKSYTFSRNIHTTPIVAIVDREEYKLIRSCKEFQDEEEKKEYERKLDQQFLEILTNYVDGKLLSSVYFIGAGFQGGWYESSLRFLCKSRRVFEGNNLYSKGACFGAGERVRKSSLGSAHIFLGEEKLKFNLGILAKKEGRVLYYPLLNGGDNWYEAVCVVDFMIEGGAYLAFLLTSLEGGVKKEVPMQLEDFEKISRKGSRISLELSMKSATVIHACVKDKGFGEFRPATGMSFERDFVAEDGTEPVMECNLALCMGSYGKEPFKLYKINRGIYSMEELCYYLCENVYLLDRDLMREELISWIDEQCTMEALAKRLRELLHFGGSLAAFVSMVLEECHYKSKEDIKRYEAVLKENENLSVYERMKNRADYLLKEKKYILAVQEYEKLLWEIGGRDKLFEGRLLHNMGCAYGKLFFFEMAAKCFLEAFQRTGEEDEIMGFLFCKRMGLSKKEYVEFTSIGESYYEAALRLESEMEQAEKAWKESAEKERLDAIKSKKEEKNGYHRAMDELLEQWKEEYLDKVLA
ncbi:MAG: hypothetical protein HDR01_15675 [Lachnospiraceae bacterium]|nr:hypothetical protein [Lachnospiraceae bacterium]